MRDNNGVGQYLDQSFDFEIDGTGDIKSAYDRDELEKDLAFQMVITLSEFLGEPPTPELNAEIKRMAYRVAVADSRVAGVDKEAIDVEWKEAMKTMRVSMTVTIDTSEEYNLVFNV